MEQLKDLVNKIKNIEFIEDNEALKKQEEEVLKKKTAILREKIKKHFGLRYCDFEEKDYKGKLKDKAKDILQNVKDIFLKQKKSFLFIGKPGTGKTLLASLIFKKCYMENVKCTYYKASDLIEFVLKDFDIGLCYVSDVLIIDEFEKRISANKNNWEVNKLLDIIDYRYNNLMSTVLIGNMQITDFIDISEALADRLKEYEKLDFDYESFRGKK